MGKKIVVALGGNALGSTCAEQKELVKNTAKSIVALIKEGNDVIIGHGNGPQVGMINLAMDYAASKNQIKAAMPFAECGAMSQGYIGYHLVQAINSELKKNNIDKKCVTVITQVEVSKDDDAFKKPTKPVGMFYTKEESEKIATEKNYQFTEDAGRGYRRVVPSPKPISIIELDVVNDLVKKGYVVITIGGGGIPVVKEGPDYIGVDAVIDKDRSSAKLASLLDADVLLILTAVEKVCLNYNTDNVIELDNLSIEECEKYIFDDQFAKGSMLPKIEACMDFIENSTNGVAIITSLDKAIDAINGKTGTIIQK